MSNHLHVQPADILDRLSILLLHRLKGGDVEATGPEFLSFSQAAGGLTPVLEEFLVLVEVNGRIWDLESDIRKGREGLLGLEEIGQRALAIRDLNKRRIEAKNRIMIRLGGFVHVKTDHASQ